MSSFNNDDDIVKYLKNKINDIIKKDKNIGINKLKKILSNIYNQKRLKSNSIFVEHEKDIKLKIRNYLYKIYKKDKNRTIEEEKKEYKRKRESSSGKKSPKKRKLSLDKLSRKNSIWYDNFKDLLEFVETGNSFKLNYETSIIEDLINKYFLNFYEYENNEDENDIDLELLIMNLLLNIANIHNSSKLKVVDDEYQFVYDMFKIERKTIGGDKIDDYLLEAYAIDNSHDFNQIFKNNPKYLFRLEDVNKTIDNYKDLELNKFRGEYGISLKEPLVFFEVLKNEPEITDDIYFLYLKNFLERNTDKPKLPKNIDIIGKAFDTTSLDEIKKNVGDFLNEFLGKKKEKHFVIDIIPGLGGPKLSTLTDEEKQRKKNKILKIANRIGITNPSSITNFLDKYLEEWEKIMKRSFKFYLRSNQLFILEDVYDSARVYLRSDDADFEKYFKKMSIDEINFLAFITKLSFDKELTLTGLDISPDFININKSFNKNNRNLFTVGYYQFASPSPTYKMAFIFKLTNIIRKIASDPLYSNLFIILEENPNYFIYDKVISPSDTSLYAIDLEILKEFNLLSKNNIGRIIHNYLEPATTFPEIDSNLIIPTLTDKEKYGVIILIYVAQYFRRIQNPRLITGGNFKRDIQPKIVGITPDINYHPTGTYNNLDDSLKINIGRALFDLKKSGDMSKILFVYYFNELINKHADLKTKVGNADKFFDWNMIYSGNDKLAVLNSLLRKQNSVIYSDQANFSLCIYKSKYEICSFQHFLNLLTVNLKLKRFDLIKSNSYDLITEFDLSLKSYVIGDNETPILLNISKLFKNYDNSKIIFFDGVFNKLDSSNDKFFINDILDLFNFDYFINEYGSLLNSQKQELNVSNVSLTTYQKIFQKKLNNSKEIFSVYKDVFVDDDIFKNIFDNFNVNKILNNSDNELDRIYIEEYKNFINDYLIVVSGYYIYDNPDLFKLYIKKMIIFLLEKIKEKISVGDLIQELLGVNNQKITNIFVDLIMKCFDEIIKYLTEKFDFTEFYQLKYILNQINLLLEIINKFLLKNPTNVFDDIFNISNKLKDLLDNVNLNISGDSIVFKEVIVHFKTLNMFGFYLQIFKQNIVFLTNSFEKLSNLIKGSYLLDLINNIKKLYIYTLLVRLNTYDFSQDINDIKKYINEFCDELLDKKNSTIKTLNKELFKEFDKILSNEEDEKFEENYPAIYGYIRALNLTPSPQAPQTQQSRKNSNRDLKFTGTAITNATQKIVENYDKIKKTEKIRDKLIKNRDTLLSLISSRFDIPSKLIEILTDVPITPFTYLDFRTPNFLEKIIITSSTSGGFKQKSIKVIKKY
jgi:hypothetical protein